MNPQPLDGGRWIDLDDAKRHTNAPEEADQQLYISRLGAFVLHDHATDTWKVLDHVVAARWFVANDHTCPQELIQHIREFEV